MTSPAAGAPASAAPSRLRRALREPGAAGHVMAALARGWWCRVWCGLRGVRLRAGRNFRVEGRLTIRGPGTVIIGNDVTIGGHVTPWTYARDAVIQVGDGSFLNGARFGCRERITVGPRAIIGDASLMDTDFHSTRADRHDSAAPVRTAPIVLHENVWIAAQAGILPGTEIGRDSVVGFGAVCAGSYPAAVVIAGNPARVVKPIPAADGAAAAD